jgi:hypothetical protein
MSARDILIQNIDLLTPFKKEFFPSGISSIIQEELLVGVLRDNRFIEFAKEDETLKIHRSNGEDFVVVGTDATSDYTVAVAINRKTNLVYSVDLNGEYKTRFVNSALHQFTACLLVYRSYSQRLTECDDEDAIVIVSEIRLKFRAIDVKVFDDPENWWGVILEQIEHGLM